MLKIIVAATIHGVIGNNQKIPWRIPQDLKIFKQMTINQSVVMGRITWDSLPSQPLKCRDNYVFTNNPLINAIAVNNFQQVQQLAKTQVWIIGGEQIYKLAIQSKLVDTIVLSRIKKEYPGNRYFYVPDNYKEYAKIEYEEFDLIYYQLTTALKDSQNANL